MIDLAPVSCGAFRLFYDAGVGLSQVVRPGYLRGGGWLRGPFLRGAPM